MGKKLAIKGHPTRGKEVIELLEMMGGNNKWIYKGSDGFVYFIEENDKYITYCGKECIKNTGEYIIYELEEFLEKYPYKVGDKVVYTKFGDNCDEYLITIESMKWTGKTIEYTFNDCVTCLAKDLKMWNGVLDVVISSIYLNSCDYADEVELNLGDYEIEVRDGKTYAVKKKPKYPTTYVECCEVLSIPSYYKLKYSTYEHDYHEYTTLKELCLLQDNLNRLGKLLICRNAYWKIAGEQMGLDKPWEPDWKKHDKKYIIDVFGDTVIYFENETYDSNTILAFPTEEMRTEFYNNFKNLIKSCKELL